MTILLLISAYKIESYWAGGRPSGKNIIDFIVTIGLEHNVENRLRMEDTVSINENIKRFLVGMGIFTIELILKIKGFYINK